MVDRVIIADDLTGALDAAAPFAMRRIPTAVALSAAALPQALATGARVVGISTDSRELAPSAARTAVQNVLAMLAPGTPLFKKVDSRLKGNVAAELDALTYRKSLVVPAIPAFGRVVYHGRITGFGVADPIDIAERLGQHAAAATIPDITDQRDIEGALDGDFDLPIGARGLAEAMAAAMAPGMYPARVDRPDGPVLCVIGSTDPITLAQLDHLRCDATELVDLAAPNGIAPPGARAGRAVTLLQATPGPVQASGQEVAASLAASLERLAPPPGAFLVLSGGATAQVVLRALGIEVLELLGEVAPGMPIARSGRLTVVTKSGGFGAPDILSDVLAPACPARSIVDTHVG